MKPARFRKATYLSLSLMIPVCLATFTVFASESSNVIPTTGYISYSPVQPAKLNGLTIALDSLGGATPQTIINFMKQWHYNALRIYMGWCSSFWTGNVDDPMNSATKTYIDTLCSLCKQNGFYVVFSVSLQVTPWKTFAPEEIQVGPNGEQNSIGNYVCVTGPKFQTFTKKLIETLITIGEKYDTPRISIDEIMYITGGGKPAFYAQCMKNAYQSETGKVAPVIDSTSGSYSAEQKLFVDFITNKVKQFFIMMKETAIAKNSNTIFQVLIDTYWVYPRTTYDTQPWDYFATFDELCYEWFYAIRDGNWQGITDGLQRIKTLNPSAKHYFIYGTSTMTTIENMRKSVELAMAEGYDGVFLYDYGKSKSNPFDVSDLIPT